MSNAFESHINTVKQAMFDIGDLDSTEVENVIGLFRKHPRIIFCTMGKPAFACAKVVYTAMSFGLEWHTLDVTHAFHGDMGIVKQGDLLVLVSKSGGTKETVDVAKYFSDWDTIALTSEGDSELVEVCNNQLVIPIDSEGSPFGHAPMVSTTLYMIVLHALLCDTVEYSKCTVEDYARNHPGGKIGEALRNIGK